LKVWRTEAPWQKDDDFIFSGEGGFIWKENYQQRHLNPLAKAAGIPKLNFQMLRRTVATHAQSMGSPKDIAAILRHRKPDTAALHYTQQQDEAVRQTTEKLAELLK
jgi:integrase